MANASLVDIGRIQAVNKLNDPENYIKTSKEKITKIADIIPVYFSMDVENMFAEIDYGYKPINLNFTAGIEEYRAKLKQVGLNTNLSGLRVWMTSESGTQEQISNNYKDNKIVEMYDQITQNTPFLKDIPNWQKSFGKQFETLPTDGKFNSISSGLTAIMDGRQLSLPKVWSKTDFSSSFNLAFRLVSPYGSPTAFRKYIGEPLLYMLAMVSPSSYDGLTYGLPPFVYLRAYGSSFMPLAIPQSVTITRNFADSRVNKYKQPLDISVSVSFSPALPGFGALLVDGGVSEITVNKLDDIGSQTLQTNSTNIAGISSLSNIIESLRPFTDGNISYKTETGSIAKSASNVASGAIDSLSTSIQSMGTTIDNSIGSITNTNTKTTPESVPVWM